MKKIKEFVDDRGRIQILADNWIRVETFGGKRRSDHSHREHGHLIYIESGEITIYERKTGATRSKPKVKVLGADDIHYTAAGVDHVMIFSNYTVFYALSDGKRDQKSYMADTVKLDYDLTKMV